jgi:toxin-antitoxin system PIN domain toxin
LTKTVRYLLDVNVLVALLDEQHIHYAAATAWFRSSCQEWSLCPLTESGFLRYATRPKTGGATMGDATAVLTRLTLEAGYHYQSIGTDWQTLTEPIFNQILGHKQITDAYLLGLAIQEDMVLATFDRAILHMAAEYSQHVLLLASS